jgi:hypothetical protein
MSDDALRAVWLSSPSIDKATLMSSIAAVLDEDRAARAKDRWIRIASVIAVGLCCPALLWCAAYGKTPLVRGAYALMAAGTAMVVCAEWMYLTWSRQALPGATNTRSQLHATALLLSRQASLIKTGLVWCAPVFLGAALIGLWIYQERSHTEGVVLWAFAATAWLVASLSGFAKGKRIDERRSRVERMLGDLGE